MITEMRVPAGARTVGAIATRLRVAGQIRQNKWDDERGNPRYATELVVTGFGDVEILARGKPKSEGETAAPPAKAEKARKKAA